MVGPRKWTLRVYTVNRMDIVTTTMVNSRYFPISGITKEVGGLISESSKKNIIRASNIEIESVIFSKLSEGRKNTNTVRHDIAIHGIIRLTV